MSDEKCRCGGRMKSLPWDIGAISRLDGKHICSNCGLAEAFRAMAEYQPPTLWEHLLDDGEGM